MIFPVLGMMVIFTASETFTILYYETLDQSQSFLRGHPPVTATTRWMCMFSFLLSPTNTIGKNGALSLPLPPCRWVRWKFSSPTALFPLPTDNTLAGESKGGCGKESLPAWPKWVLGWETGMVFPLVFVWSRNDTAKGFLFREGHPFPSVLARRNRLLLVCVSWWFWVEGLCSIPSRIWGSNKKMQGLTTMWFPQVQCPSSLPSSLSFLELSYVCLLLYLGVFLIIIGRAWGE